jgi:hypothetical protein
MNGRDIVQSVITLAIHPVRVAWIIDNATPSFLKGLITINTRLWGGMQNTFVPIINGKIKDLWLNFLESYDPDIVIVASDESEKIIENLNRYFVDLNPFFIYDWDDLQERPGNIPNSSFGIGMNSHLISHHYDERFDPSTYQIIRLELVEDHPLYNSLISFCGIINDCYDHDINYEPIKIPHQKIFPKVIDPDTLSQSKELHHMFHKVTSSLLRGEHLLSNRKKIFSERKIIPLLFQNMTNLVTNTEFGTGREGFHLYPPIDCFFVLFFGDMNNVENFCIYWNLRLTYENVLWLPKSDKDLYLQVFWEVLEYNLTLYEIERIKVFFASVELSEKDLESLFENMERFNRYADFEILYHDKTSQILITHSMTTDSPSSQPGYFVDRQLLHSDPVLNNFVRNLPTNEGMRSFVVEISSQLLNIPNRKFANDLYSISQHTYLRISKSKIRLILGEMIFPENIYLDFDKNLPYSGDIQLLIRNPSAFEILNSFLNTYLASFNDVSLSPMGRFNQQIKDLFISLENVYNHTIKPYSRLILGIFLYGEKYKRTEKFLNKFDFSHSELKQFTEKQLLESSKNNVHINSEHLREIRTGINELLANLNIQKDTRTQGLFIEKDLTTFIWNKRASFLHESNDFMVLFFENILIPWLRNQFKLTPKVGKYNIFWRIDNFIEDFMNYQKINLDNSVLESLLKICDEINIYVEKKQNKIISFIESSIKSLSICTNNSYEDLIDYITQKPKISNFDEVRTIEGYIAWLKCFFSDLLNYNDLSAHEKQFERTLDWFVSNDIIFQGLRLYCSVCLKRDWYSLREVSVNYICNRCLNSSKVPINPEFSYKINEVVFQGLNHKSYLTLWTLYCLQQQSKYPFIYTEEIHVHYANTNKKAEIDFFGVKDGKIIMGEVKSNFKSLKNKEIARLENFLKSVKPEEFYLVFNSLGDEKLISFENRSAVKRLKRKLKKNGVTLIIWTRENLVRNEIDRHYISNFKL